MSTATSTHRSIAMVVRNMEAGTIETSKKKMTATAIWSNDACDHYRTVFHQGGCDFSHFDSNGGVIQYEHSLSRERGSLPIANALEYGCDKYKGRNCIVGTAKFWEGDEFAEARFRDVEAGRIRGWSIRAIPVHTSPLTREELRARPDWAEAEACIREWKLMEVSLVSIPGGVGTNTITTGRNVAGFDAGGGLAGLTPEQAERVMREVLKDQERRHKRIRKAIRDMLPDITRAVEMAAERRRGERRV